MEPIWKLSGPPAPERMMAGRATEPVSTFTTLLNCCCSTVDLRGGGRGEKGLGEDRETERWVEGAEGKYQATNTILCFMDHHHQTHGYK